MSLSSELLMLLGSIGAIQSFFLAFYVISIGGRKRFQNYLLGALFMVLGIRVGKSILWAFWSQTPLEILNLGFAAHAASGPLLLLYVYYYLNQAKNFNKLHYLQFLPALLILLFSSGLTLSEFWYRNGYTFLLYYQLFYAICTVLMVGYLLFIKKVRLNRKNLYWTVFLSLGVLIWGMAYFSNYILGWTSYLLGPILYSVIIYILSFMGLRHQDLFRAIQKKYKNLNLEEDEILYYHGRLIKVMEQDKIYLEPDCTLSRISAILTVPPYILSHILNDQVRANFSEFINRYRIREAKVMLADPSRKHYKIATIAYDCGFNSLSAFNAAFKKESRMTPSQFRDQPKEAS